MRKLTSLIGAAGLSAMLLAGCGQTTPKDALKKPTPHGADYAFVMRYNETIKDLKVGDVNGDGKLDIIVAISFHELFGSKDYEAVKVYEGDGKGNFNLRQYPAK